MAMSLSGDICVVTGACGFLGEKLVRLLLEDEKLLEIRLLDRNIRPGFIQSLEGCRGETKLTEFGGDIRDRELLKRACRGATVIFHTASLIDVIGAINYSELHGVNVKGTQLLLETCIQENVPSFIYTSSIEVAGPNPRGEPIINGHMRDGIRNGDVLLRTSQREAKVNPVYVGNAALAHLQAARALKDPQKRAVVGGNFYYISDNTPHVSYSDFNHAVLSPLGFGLQDKPTLPFPVLYLISFFMEMLQAVLRPFLRFTPPLNRQLLIMLNTPFSFSYQKAHRDLGYTPRYEWAEARQRTTDWLASVLARERERISAK
ncbi:hypothetical protein SRHO_G00109970 [Serrasalmus rhombeus]